MKTLNGNSIFPNYYLVIIFILPLLFLPFMAYAHQSGNVRVELEINIDSNERFYGKLTFIYGRDIIKTELGYILLPFEIKNVAVTNSAIQVSYIVTSEGFAIINYLIAPNAPSEGQVTFEIYPFIRNSTELSVSDLDHAKNFLLVENRGGAENTLRFRYNTQLVESSFGNLTNYLDTMTMISEIRIKFPFATKFITIHPSYRSSNITEQPYAGIQINNEFITSIDFYRARHLYINYVLPTSVPALTLMLHVLVLALSPLGSIIIALPEDMLSKTARIRIAVICILLVPIMLIINWVVEGREYFVDNLVSLLPAVVLYLLTLSIVLANIYSTIRNFFTWIWGTLSIKKT